MEQRIRQLWEQIYPQIAPYLTLGRISLIVGGLFLIIYGALGFIYMTEGLSQQDMEDRLAQQKNILGRSTARAQEVESEYQRVQDAIPLADLTEIDVFKAILQLGGDSGVAPQISSRGESTETFGGQVYRVIQFQVSAVGPVEAVDDFFRKLDGEQTLLETLVVDTASLTGGTTQMSFNVYTLPGEK